MDMAYLDFSKAFDVVSHLLLLDKLQLLGFDPIVISWIKSFLIGRTMSVSVSGTSSLSMPVTSGVPQGSVLGPLLFLIYVNFITVAVAGCWVAFADDFKLCVCYPRNNVDQQMQASVRLQNDLNNIADTSLSWNLKLNPAKCVIMRFGERSGTDQVAYSIYGTNLIFVDSYKDLGVTIDSGLKFHAHVNAVIGKAGAMINNLLRSTVCRSVEFMLTLYVSHIRPIIEYGSCVWNVGYLEDERRIERLQRKWTREIDGLTGLDYVSRLKKIGLYSIKGRLLRIDLIQIWKAFHSDVDV